MENTAADHYWNDVCLTMNVSGLDWEQSSHRWVKIPQEEFPLSSAQFVEEHRTVEMLLALTSPSLKHHHSFALQGTPKSQSQSPFLPNIVQRWANSPCPGNIVKLSSDDSIFQMCLNGIQGGYTILSFGLWTCTGWVRFLGFKSELVVVIFDRLDFFETPDEINMEWI